MRIRRAVDFGLILFVFVVIAFGALLLALPTAAQEAAQNAPPPAPTDWYAIALLVFGALLSAALYVVHQQGKRLADSIPPSVLPTIDFMLEIAAKLADRTTTPDDDALIERIREELLNAPPVRLDAPGPANKIYPPAEPR